MKNKVAIFVVFFISIFLIGCAQRTHTEPSFKYQIGDTVYHNPYCNNYGLKKKGNKVGSLCYFTFKEEEDSVSDCKSIDG